MVHDRHQDDDRIYAADHWNAGGVGQREQKDAAGSPGEKRGDNLGLNDLSQWVYCSVPSLLQQGQ
jgi:hypothetical protein